MTRTNMLKRPFYLGLIVLFSAFASTAAVAPAFAQDATPADNAAAVVVDEAAATEPVADEAVEAEPVAEETAATEPVADEAAEELEIVASEPTEAKEKSNFYLVLAFFVALAAFAWAVAALSAKRFRQPHFRAAYFIIVFCFVGGLLSTITGLKQGRVNLGVDLRGGSILVYKVSPSDPKKTDVSADEMNDLKNALMKRINPSGVREISIQELGANTDIRITIPEADPAEVARLKRVINNAGQLQFRILAVAGASDSQEKAVVDRALAKENADA
ncbi:MAG: hypothetical protein IIW01_02395, partial [Thermoguttaceae bacterium]|nr:hypothetical protein [Thermoguttaceae bacterium]